MQNERNAMTFVVDPTKKDTASVNDVIEIEGPAIDMASFIRFSTESFILV